MLTHMTILQPDAIDKMEPFGKIISNVSYAPKHIFKNIQFLPEDDQSILIETSS